MLLALLPVSGIRGMLVGVLMGLHVLALSYNYQNREYAVKVFYALVPIGIICTIWMQMLFVIPLIIINLMYLANIGYLRSFSAAILGVLTPFWFWGAYAILTGTTDEVAQQMASLINDLHNPMAIVDSELWTLYTLAAAVVLLAIIITTVWLYRNNKKDEPSVKEQMIFGQLQTLIVIMIVLMLAQPLFTSVLMPMIAVCIAPITAYALQTRK